MNEKVLRSTVGLVCILMMILALVRCGKGNDNNNNNNSGNAANDPADKKLKIGFLSGLMEIQWEQDMEAELKRFAE